jgi:hypothetical protein
MTDRAIPLTQPGPQWSQREYVACCKLNIGFSAHRYGTYRQAFHYGFPEDIGCTTVIVGPVEVETYIDHDFVKGINWIHDCAAATPKP